MNKQELESEIKRLKERFEKGKRSGMLPALAIKTQEAKIKKLEEELAGMEEKPAENAEKTEKKGKKGERKRKAEDLKEIPEFEDWMGDVYDEIEEYAEVTRSDAQGIADTMEDELKSLWIKATDPKKAARKIVDKNKKAATHNKPSEKKKPSKKASGDKEEWEGGHIVMKKSDTEAILQYKGDSKMTAHFEFIGDKWKIDCCVMKGEKFPAFGKSELDEAIEYTIGEIECHEESLKKKKAAKKRKEYNKKQAKKSESTKAQEAVEKVAESVENKLEDENVTPAAARAIKDDILDIVVAVEASMHSRKDGKDFVRKLIAELEKLLK
jgi:hypothetical protein